ncbi:hypothetical protein AAY473_035798 [Plecturocebus cupreus]
MQWGDDSSQQPQTPALQPSSHLSLLSSWNYRRMCRCAQLAYFLKAGGHLAGMALLLRGSPLSPSDEKISHSTALAEEMKGVRSLRDAEVLECGGSTMQMSQERRIQLAGAFLLEWAAATSLTPPGCCLVNNGYTIRGVLSILMYHGDTGNIVSPPVSKPVKPHCRRHHSQYEMWLLELCLPKLGNPLRHGWTRSSYSVTSCLSSGGRQPVIGEDGISRSHRFNVFLIGNRIRVALEAGDGK